MSCEYQREEVAKKVVRIIAEQTWINEEDVRPEADFAADLYVDSVGIYEIIMKLEQSFSITIESGAEKFKKVQDMIDMVMELYQAKPAVSCSG